MGAFFLALLIALFSNGTTSGVQTQTHGNSAVTSGVTFDSAGIGPALQ